MFFKQFQVPGLGCYSYIAGCPGAGLAMVVDPERHVEQYIETAAANDMKITHIFDTHLHADHISGARELAARTGAALCVHHAHPAAYDHQPVREGDAFDFGVVHVEVLETPGHTPNSISLVLSDRSRADAPMAIFTGDLLFVGDIGRPDLAGEDMLAEQVKNLYDSLYEKLGALPDWLEVYPAHGAGSLCGKGISPKSMSVLGFEQHHNPLLNGMPFEEFNKLMTAGFEVRPPGYVCIVDTNAAGPMLLGDLPAAEELSVETAAALARDPATVIVDTREAEAFSAGHLPGAMNVGMGDNMASWLSTVVDVSSNLLVIAENPEDAQNAIGQFRRVGFDAVAGFYTGPLESITKDLPILSEISPADLKKTLADNPGHIVLDVRSDSEWGEGHIGTAIHCPLPRLRAEGPPLDPNAEISCICRSGYRSNIAASYLLSQGFTHVDSVLGGMDAWEKMKS